MEPSERKKKYPVGQFSFKCLTTNGSQRKDKKRDIMQNLAAPFLLITLLQPINLSSFAWKNQVAWNLKIHISLETMQSPRE